MNNSMIKHGALALLLTGLSACSNEAADAYHFKFSITSSD